MRACSWWISCVPVTWSLFHDNHHILARVFLSKEKKLVTGLPANAPGGGLGSIRSLEPLWDCSVSSLLGGLLVKPWGQGLGPGDRTLGHL